MTQITWTRWGDRLVALAAIGATAGLAHAWVTQYANPEGNGFFSQKISGPIVDRMPYPADTGPIEPIVGMHYFSDLQLAVAYGKTANPYLIDYPAQYPPLGILEFRLLGLFGYEASLWLLMIGTLATLGFVGWRLMGHLASSRKIVNLVFLLAFTPAMIMSFDRGALSPLATGMVGLAFLAARWNRRLTSAVLLILAISLKPYLGLVLLYPLFRGHWRFATVTAALTVLINSAAFGLFPGGFMSSVQGFVNASLRYADTDAAVEHATTIKFLTLDSVSVAGTFLRTITFTKNIDVASMIYDQHIDLVLVPGILFLIALIIVLVNRRLPFWIPLTLTLATATAVFPATPLYTLSWATLAAFYFGSSGGDPFPITREQNNEQELTLLRIPYLIALALCLAPTFWLLPGIERGNQDAAGFLGPLALLIAVAMTLLVTIADFVRRWRTPSTG